jgi:hypothetical protein
MSKFRVLAATVVAAGLGIAAPAPAFAGADDDCRVNLVCLYTADGAFAGEYSEYTGYFQQLSRSDVVSAKNLTPSVVYFNYASGNTSCMIANQDASLIHPGYGAVTGLRLSSARTCYGAPA